MSHCLRQVSTLSRTPLQRSYDTLALASFRANMTVIGLMAAPKIHIKRYLDKLCLLGLSVDNDPYAAINSKNFVSDMSLWPPVEFGHIFCYFIDRPGVYTRQQLLQWKQLNAYYFFTSGFV
eukprot:Em0007g1412a